MPAMKNGCGVAAIISPPAHAAGGSSSSKVVQRANGEQNHSLNKMTPRKAGLFSHLYVSLITNRYASYALTGKVRPYD